MTIPEVRDKLDSNVEFTITVGSGVKHHGFVGFGWNPLALVLPIAILSKKN